MGAGPMVLRRLTLRDRFLNVAERLGAFPDQIGGFVLATGRMDYFSKFLRTGSQPPPKVVHDHALEFHQSWNFVRVRHLSHFGRVID